MKRTMIKMIAGFGLIAAVSAPAFAQYGFQLPPSWNTVYDGRTNPTLVPFGSGRGLTWGAPPIGMQGGTAEAMLYDYNKLMQLFGNVGQGGGYGTGGGTYNGGMNGSIYPSQNPYNAARMQGWNQRENAWLNGLAQAMTAGYW